MYVLEIEITRALAGDSPATLLSLCVFSVKLIARDLNKIKFIFWYHASN